jgi:hypothetical protein
MYIYVANMFQNLVKSFVVNVYLCCNMFQNLVKSVYIEMHIFVINVISFKI